MSFAAKEERKKTKTTMLALNQNINRVFYAELLNIEEVLECFI